MDWNTVCHGFQQAKKQHRAHRVPRAANLAKIQSPPARYSRAPALHILRQNQRDRPVDRYAPGQPAEHAADGHCAKAQANDRHARRVHRRRVFAHRALGASRTGCGTAKPTSRARTETPSRPTAHGPTECRRSAEQRHIGQRIGEGADQPAPMRASPVTRACARLAETKFCAMTTVSPAARKLIAYAGK